jgi:hypothetical protein
MTPWCRFAAAGTVGGRPVGVRAGAGRRRRRCDEESKLGSGSDAELVIQGGQISLHLDDPDAEVLGDLLV